MNNSKISYINNSEIENNEEISKERLKELDEEHEQYIQEQYDKGIIINYSNIKNNNEYEIDLDLSEELEKRDIIQKFIIHKIHKYVKIELNHKYEKSTIILPTNNIKYWQKFHDNLDKEFDRKRIQDKDDIRLIHNVLDYNHDLILGLNENNDNEKREEKAIEQKDNSTAELLLDLFNEQDPKPVLFKDQVNVAHVLININSHYKVLPIEDITFRRYLSKLYYDNINEVPNAEAVRNVVQLLAAKSIFEGDTMTLHLRAAWSSNETRDSIYYDMSDSKNRCVKITSYGCTILENQTDILFRRYNHQIPQVEPSFDNLDDQDDVLEQFITLLNIKNENDRLLLKCYIVSLFIPDIPHVILILLGE